MDIKCKFNPNYSYSFPNTPNGVTTLFCGVPRLVPDRLQKSCDRFVKRPAEAECAAGLSDNNNRLGQRGIKALWAKVKNHAKTYVQNIKHTYEHKIIFALIEKELFGKNSIDSLTHDADKMILYILGFPKSFVSEFHRKHSTHHPESGKKMNLKSMLCDNIASSPEFKPEKKLSLREHFNTNPALQNVDGLKEIFEKYHYGECLNFKKINAEKERKYSGLNGFTHGAGKLVSIGFF